MSRTPPPRHPPTTVDVVAFSVDRPYPAEKFARPLTTNKNRFTFPRAYQISGQRPGHSLGSPLDDGPCICGGTRHTIGGACFAGKRREDITRTGRLRISGGRDRNDGFLDRKKPTRARDIVIVRKKTRPLSARPPVSKHGREFRSRTIRTTDARFGRKFARYRVCRPS